MISRDKAAQIATSFAIDHGLGTRVYDVRLMTEIEHSPAPYSCSLENCWIAYVEHIGPPMLCSSTIIAIDKESGQVIYSGAANDEDRVL